MQITINSPKTDWKQWIKTIGVLSKGRLSYKIKFRGEVISFKVEQNKDEIRVLINKDVCKEKPEFVKLLKSVFRKSACCVMCKECQADCHYGNLYFKNNDVVISDNCTHCAQCHKVEKGCLVYKSLEDVKGGVTMIKNNSSLNSYSHFAPKMDWIKQFFTYKDEFDSQNNLGSQMFSFFKRFLRDAGLLKDNEFSALAKKCEEVGLESETAWGIIFVNLCDTPQTNWLVRVTDFENEYSKEYLASLMLESGAKEGWTNDIFSAISRITELPIGKLGYGSIIKEKNRKTGFVRTPWQTPIPEVILYSLFKFSEACDGYYQFSLSELMDDTIERGGISPTRIFGLSRETMIALLNGLATHYPEFIRASFTLDLETITLSSDKTSEDVLNLF